jgi:hypothetical protein
MSGHAVIVSWRRPDPAPVFAGAAMRQATLW